MKTIKALKRIGDTYKGHVNYFELIILIQKLIWRTNRSGEVIGNGLKTIFTRLSRPSTKEVIEYSDFTDFLCKFNKLEDKNKVAEVVGGVFQINLLKACV